MTYQFKCDSHNGLQEVSGSISFDENNLNFEYQANPLGLIKGDVKEISIPFSQIEEIEYVEKFLSRKLIITVSSLKNLDKFPLIEDYIIKIPVKRKLKEKANEFSIKVNFNLGHYKLNLLE